MPVVRIHYRSGIVGRVSVVTEAFLQKLQQAVEKGSLKSVEKVEVIRR